MTISTYAELKTAIGTYMGRSDLTDRADEFIDKVEAKFRRRLRLRPMEVTTTGAMVADTPTIPLPTDFLQVISFIFEIGSENPRKLEFITPEQGDALEYGSSGTPRWYTFVGQAIRIYPTPDSAYDYTIRHYAKFAPLSASNTTNFLLTEYPDAYEYGCYIEACAYLGDIGGQLQVWVQGFETTMAEIKRSDRCERNRTPTMHFDPALLGAGSSNIETDS